MNRIQLREKLTDLVSPVVCDHGAELVDIEIKGHPGNPTVRLLVHREPAITVDQCEQISREVADLLDVEDPLPGRYRLEVTSPGLGRPLHTDRDFARASQRWLKVVMRTGETLNGVLQRWDETAITLKTDDGSGQELVVQRENIAKATIKPEL